MDTRQRTQHFIVRHSSTQNLVKESVTLHTPFTADQKTGNGNMYNKQEHRCELSKCWYRVMRPLENMDELAVGNFREYLRIPSVQPDVNYDDCVAFLWRQAEGMGLPMKVHELVALKPIVVITWLGKEPSLPSVMLNSHMDVVPVYEECWTRPPFGAEQDEQGNIYGRGAQDTKGAGMQYLEAIRRLKTAGIRLRRTVHISYMPDEEIGGKDGMKIFVRAQEFRDLNIGFAFDEGLAHPDNIIQIVYGERSIWQVTFHCCGTAGSSEMLLADTAGEKVRIIMDRAMEYRQTQKGKLESDPTLTTGDVTSLNLTMMTGGNDLAGDVPKQLSVTFDIRVSLTEDHENVLAMLKTWCEEAGPGVHYEFRQKQERVEPTRLDEHNLWWLTFKAESDKLGLNLQSVICPASGDSRYLRAVGVPTLGFAPMCNTPVLMHDHNEFLNEQVFLRGIDIYCHLVHAMANLAP